jgi:hypothetical protein
VIITEVNDVFSMVVCAAVHQQEPLFLWIARPRMALKVVDPFNSDNVVGIAFGARRNDCVSIEVDLDPSRQYLYP